MDVLKSFNVQVRILLLTWKRKNWNCGENWSTSKAKTEQTDKPRSDICDIADMIRKSAFKTKAKTLCVHVCISFFRKKFCLQMNSIFQQWINARAISNHRDFLYLWHVSYYPLHYCFSEKPYLHFHHLQDSCKPDVPRTNSIHPEKDHVIFIGKNTFTWKRMHGT